MRCSLIDSSDLDTSVGDSYTYKQNPMSLSSENESNSDRHDFANNLMFVGLSLLVPFVELFLLDIYDKLGV